MHTKISLMDFGFASNLQIIWYFSFYCDSKKCQVSFAGDCILQLDRVGNGEKLLWVSNHVVTLQDALSKRINKYANS